MEKQNKIENVLGPITQGQTLTVSIVLCIFSLCTLLFPTNTASFGVLTYRGLFPFPHLLDVLDLVAAPLVLSHASRRSQSCLVPWSASVCIPALRSVRLGLQWARQQVRSSGALCPVLSVPPHRTPTAQTSLSPCLPAVCTLPPHLPSNLPHCFLPRSPLPCSHPLSPSTPPTLVPPPLFPPLHASHFPSPPNSSPQLVPSTDLCQVTIRPLRGQRKGSQCPHLENGPIKLFLR